MRRGRLWVAIAALVATTIPLLIGASGASSVGLQVVFNFEDASQVTTTVNGWQDGSCRAVSWLGSNAGAPSQSSAQKSEGTYSLAQPVKFVGGSWEQAGIDCVLTWPRPWNLAGYGTISADVWVPSTGISADVGLNGPWNPGPTKALVAGWNTITSSMLPGGDFGSDGVTLQDEMLVRVIGRGAVYTGPVYIDNIRIIPSPYPVVFVTAPKRDETIEVPVGGMYDLTANIGVGDNPIAAVAWSSDDGQSGAMAYDSGTGNATAQWDPWASGDGLHKVTVTATDTMGGSGSASVNVLVQNSQLQVQTVSPTFDSQLKGWVTVKAKVKPDPRFALKRVVLEAGKLRVTAHLGAPDSDGWRSASFSLNTHWLKDGALTLRVVATDSNSSVAGLIDVVVRNHPVKWTYARTHKTDFAAGGKPFRYVGWNEYELFTRVDQTTTHVDETIDGQVIPKGTMLTWQYQIDKEMLEAQKHHLTVLRTWAFDENNEAQAFQYPIGTYNEPTFKKLDYILDSAKRHDTRVILTLANYWGDYGGINAYTSQLGLPSKLLFFTDATARAQYEAYIAHLVNRVNTVNGVAYKKDPTIFSWELMNEPRDSCADDPVYCDASGVTLRNWVTQEATYIHGIDKNHMVDGGFEGHGLVQTPSGPYQWAGTEEGDGNDPYFAQAVKGIDFLSYHPYPNEWWMQPFNYAQTKDLITGLTQMGVKYKRPVIMGEWGVTRAQVVTDRAGNVIGTGDPDYNKARADWYKMIIKACYVNGCAGTNIWMLADWADNTFNVNLYKPYFEAKRDAPIVKTLDMWGAWLSH
jgi:hypothetical protein